jgi:endonuclease YncB( thermonuclease family)
MKRTSLLAIVTALSFLAFSLTSDAKTTSEAKTPRLRGTVTRVIDGDTLEVKLSSGPIRVRLYGVDAPERRQSFGKESTAVLEELVGGKAVEIAPESQDRYSRIVGVVYVGKQSINGEMIERGAAWAYRRYMHKSDADYCRFEISARKSKRGLWKASEARAPWEFRRKGPFLDYSRETEALCIASIGQSKSKR